MPSTLCSFFQRLTILTLLFCCVGRPALTQSFVRGDANLDGIIDISDATSMLSCLFLGGDCPDECRKVADTNDDGAADIADPILLLNFLFLGGRAPLSPFPECGQDPTADNLFCRSYPHCRVEPGVEAEGEGEAVIEPGRDEGAGEGQTTVPPDSPPEVDPDTGAIELQLTAQLPRGVDEAFFHFASIEWRDSAGGSQLLESLPTAVLGPVAATRLPAAQLPPGRYSSVRLLLASIDFVRGGESNSVHNPPAVVIAFTGALAVQVETGKTTVVVVDLSLVDQPFTGVFVDAKVSPIISVSPLQLVAMEQLERTSRIPPRITFDEGTRTPVFVAGEWEVDPQARTPELQAISFLRQSSALLALNPAVDGFVVQSVRESRTLGTMVRLQQTYNGIPVFGADMVVRLREGSIRGFNGRFLAAADLGREVRISGSQAFLLAQADLAVGTPHEHLGSTQDSGLVNIFYGSNQGLIQPNGTMSWEGFTQSLVGASNEEGDQFGWSLAAGNFDADAYEDLAIGVPHEDIGSRVDAGVVNLVHGSSQGLIRSGPTMRWERVSQSTFGAENENGDRFGWSLAVGKFSNGSHDDLAIGSPGEDLDGRSNAGMVTIIYGANTGLYPPAGWHRLAQANAGGANESGDEFGLALTTGNLNGDAWDELVVGEPNENALGKTDNGVVRIFYGSSQGLFPSGWEWFGQSLTGGSEDDSDRYGWAIACGDFDNNGNDDLAASAPWEDAPGEVITNVGAVYVREY